MNPNGKVALVTGGARRVGKAITLMLARCGVNVVINYNASSDDAEQTASEARSAGVEALALQGDVSNSTAVRSMTDAILERFGGVDIIVNSASLFGQFPFPTNNAADLETWQRVTRISIDGPFFVCNNLAPSMLERAQKTNETGAIVNIVDLSVWHPWPNFMAHAVGKAGLLALTRHLATELAPTIRVNAIAPGPVMPSPNYPESRLQEQAQRTLLQRWGEADDVAKAVKYLIEADYVTGDVMTVDGGERYGVIRNSAV
ncbi:SDR family oxidoreductase [Chloroflexi bacterium TSY]|nr:SDR family oxidoreductase [Chloroflexi bacterium TSY]